MRNARRSNVFGALVLAMADEVQRAAQAQAPEPGPAAAALVLIGHEPGLTLDGLRRAVGLSHPGGVRLVDRLAAADLVERRRSELDGRAVALHLTEAGEKACAQILQARGEALARGLASLDGDEADILAGLAEKMLRGVLRDEDHAYQVCRLCDFVSCTDCPVETAVLERSASGVGAT